MKVQAAVLLGTCLAGQSFAQVRCTMPNGVIIEQKLSDTCPAGARKAEKADGGTGKIRGSELTPPAPIVMDRLSRKTQEIRREELGKDWPLTVAHGTLSCMYPVQGRRNLPALLITAGGITYGINGTADAHAATYGWRDIRPIWRDNPAIPGTKIPIAALLNRGAALCK